MKILDFQFLHWLLLYYKFSIKAFGLKTKDFSTSQYIPKRMKILRDLRLSTKLLILLEITRKPHIKLKTIAEKIGISIQGVSEYLKIMNEEKLIQNIGGEYKVTTNGIQFLHKNFSELKDFVDKSIEKLDLIEVCAAIAKTKIKKGERVGLFMENGILNAYSGRKSKSSGFAIMDADIDEDVPVKNLEGIVELNHGKLCIIEIPSIIDGGSRKIDIKEIKNIYMNFKPNKIAVLDVVGISLAKKAKLKYDFEFAPQYSIIEAIQKGLNIMIFGTHDSVQNLRILNNEIGIMDFNEDIFKIKQSKDNV